MNIFKRYRYCGLIQRYNGNVCINFVSCPHARFEWLSYFKGERHRQMGVERYSGEQNRRMCIYSSQNWIRKRSEAVRVWRSPKRFISMSWGQSFNSLTIKTSNQLFYPFAVNIHCRKIKSISLWRIFGDSAEPFVYFWIWFLKNSIVTNVIIHHLCHFLISSIWHLTQHLPCVVIAFL